MSLERFVLKMHTRCSSETSQGIHASEGCYIPHVLIFQIHCRENTKLHRYYQFGNFGVDVTRMFYAKGAKRRMVSSGMLRRVAFVRTDVS
jgi:hypothetical protein